MANYQARLLNLDLLNFGSGAESADALQPRATPWVSGSIGPPCKGGGLLRPFRAEHVPGHIPGALPRAGMLRAVGASSWLSSRSEKTAKRQFGSLLAFMSRRGRNHRRGRRGRHRSSRCRVIGVIENTRASLTVEKFLVFGALQFLNHVRP